jgi:antitoxin HicB
MEDHDRLRGAVHLSPPALRLAGQAAKPQQFRSYHERMARRRRRREPLAPPQRGEKETASSNLEPARGDRAVVQSRKEYLNLPYQIALRADERNQGWIAYVEELPGCEAHGDNPEQATRHLRGAMERWVSEALERGEAIPEPRVLSGHSGRLLLRMPQSLHAELARAADIEGISLNQFITTALASAVAWRNQAAPDSRRRVSTGSDAGPSAAAGERTRPSRSRSVLLATNLIVLIVVGALAIALLLTAWYEI